MSISTRYRALVEEIEAVLDTLRAAAGEGDNRPLRQVEKGLEHLAPLREGIGEIPQVKLDKEVSPVLLRAHTSLDRGRVLFEEAGEPETAKKIWDLEQKIYRLLNDL